MPDAFDKVRNGACKLRLKTLSHIRSCAPLDRHRITTRGDRSKPDPSAMRRVEFEGDSLR